jgi:hypothetical protein
VDLIEDLGVRWYLEGGLGAGCGGGFGNVRVKMEWVGGLVVWCGE